MNLEQDVEKDSRYLYKCCMIHSPMAVYIIDIIIISAVNLYISIKQIIRFLCCESRCFYSLLVEEMKIIHFERFNGVTI
jgi:E3 ubiquitin-protein ligase DOA10